MPIKSNSLKPRTKSILRKMHEVYGNLYFHPDDFKQNYWSDFSINDKQNLVAKGYLVRSPLVGWYRLSRSRKLSTLLGLENTNAQSN